MSLSEPTVSTKNPAKKFIEFKPKLGVFQYWEKNQGEVKEGDSKGENKVIENPRFLVIDNGLMCVIGWDDNSNSKIFSNDTSKFKSSLVVRAAKGGVIAEGSWQDTKDKIKAAGGSYARSIYAVMDGEIVKITMGGAARGAWMDFEKDKNLEGKIITLAGLEKKKKGSNEFNSPIFEASDPTDEEVASATEMDKDLQTYFKAQGIETPEVTTDFADEPAPTAEEDPLAGTEGKEDVKSKVDVDDLPF